MATHAADARRACGAAVVATRTDFILGAARRTGEDALLDRALILVGPAKVDKFLALLDRPAKPNARLRRAGAPHDQTRAGLSPATP